ncbi:MAG: GAF domain-containing protein, partial [Candidatus Pacebacteria bacterium]|nr:GAF domain-containing protein [Candidatus Paceibacterota bacterium]
NLLSSSKLSFKKYYSYYQNLKSYELFLKLFNYSILVLPVVGFLLGLWLDSDLLSLILCRIALALTVIPLILHVRKDPMSEDLNSWGMFVLAAILSFVALDRIDPLVLLVVITAFLSVVIPWFAIYRVQSGNPKNLESILLHMKYISNADGATIYEVLPDKPDEMAFRVVINSSLNIQMGGTSGKPVVLKNLHIRDHRGAPNLTTMATSVFHTMKTLHISDIYQDTAGFNLKGSFEFDKAQNYRTQSILTVPLISKLGKVVGVVQLINPIDSVTGKPVDFTAEQIDELVSLGNSAGEALETLVILRHIKNPVVALFVSIMSRVAVGSIRVINAITKENFLKI